MSIHIDNSGTGYFHGYEVQAISYHDYQNLIKFVHKEGMNKDDFLFQPLESVKVSS